MTAIWSKWTHPIWRSICNAPANTGSTSTAPANVTNVSVWSGRGEVTGGGYSYTVVAGQSARFSGTDQLNYDIATNAARRMISTTGRFSATIDEDGAESANYVSPEMTGYEDLDDYGRWQYVGGYGTVWVPSERCHRIGLRIAMATGPISIPGAGPGSKTSPGASRLSTTDAGPMPKTAGAGCRDRLPSGRCMRPHWWLLSAASGFAIGGGPGVAWFPLAPGEVYVPYYRGSRGYVERLNVTNTVVNVTRVTNDLQRAQRHQHHAT